MKISGFTIVRNAVKFNYPVLESIQSILPVCDEFIVNVGDSEDQTLRLIESLNNPKIRIIQNRWDFSKGKEVLSIQTNLALKECKGDWAFYLQSDEVIHESDLPALKELMREHLDNKEAEALRFRWLHFYGSYFRYRIDSGWYQKQDRIIRNDGQIRSVGDAYSFERRDKAPIKRIHTRKLLYHYGWVHDGEVMTQRRVNAEKIGFTALREGERKNEYAYGDLNRFPVYFGSHPLVMKDRVSQHALSREDEKNINKRFWWHPFWIFKVRYKTSKRIKTKIE